MKSASGSPTCPLAFPEETGLDWAIFGYASMWGVDKNNKLSTSHRRPGTDQCKCPSYKTICSRKKVGRIETNCCAGEKRFIYCSCCSTPHSPLDTNSFALATRGAKATRTSKTVLGEQIGDVLSLPRIGSLGGGSTKL